MTRNRHRNGYFIHGRPGGDGIMCAGKALTAICLCAAAFLWSGCASKWSIRTEPAESQLQWPQQAEMPKVKFIMTIKGFEEAGSSNTVKTFLIGREEAGEFSKPVAVTRGADGRLAVADTGTKCVHLYIPGEEKYVRVYKTDKEEIVSPVGVAFDDDLRLYVSDSVLAKILVFDREGAFLFSIDKAYFLRLKRPTGLAYNPDKKLIYAVDTLANKIYAFDSSGNAVFSFGERGIGNGQFNFPTQIFFSKGGLFYVTDTMNFRAQIFDDSGNFISAFGHHGDGSGDMAMPKGIAADADGIVYVVDTLFDNVQLFTKQGQFLLTIGGRGVGQGEFWLPSGIFIDNGDRLYVCDTYNQRIQVFQINEKFTGKADE